MRQVDPARPAYDDVRARLLGEVGAAQDRIRPFLIGPTFAVALVLLLVSGYPLERIAVAAGSCALTIGWQVLRPAIDRRRGRSERRVFLGLLFVIVVLGIFVGATGGLRGPFVPILFPITVAGAIRFGRSGRSVIVVLVAVAVVIAIGLLPEAVAGPPVAPGWNTFMTGLVAVLTFVLLAVNVIAFAHMYVRAGETIDELRREALIDAAEHERSLRSVTARVAHELKNPLAAVKGLIHLLAEDAAEAGVQKRFAVVTGEVARMEVILRDYLSFARPLTDLRPEPVELGRLTDQVLAALEGEARRAGVSLGRSGEATVAGDPRRLKEALLNLMSNALEATPRGGSISVSVSTAPAGGADVAIRDSGRGMDAEALARIGTPFFTTRADGTGLGVALARSVVEQHGGELRYESVVGRGTTVTVALPAGRLSASDDRSRRSSPA